MVVENLLAPPSEAPGVPDDGVLTPEKQETSTPTEPETYEAWLEQVAAKETHKAFLDEHITRKSAEMAEVFRPHAEAMEVQAKERLAALNQTGADLRAFHGELRKAVRNLSLDQDGLEDLLDAHPGLAESLKMVSAEYIKTNVDDAIKKQITRTQAESHATGAQWAVDVMFKALGRPATTLLGELQRPGAMKSWEDYATVLGKAAKEIYDAGEKHGLGLRANATNEEAKLAARASAGGDVLKGQAAGTGSKRYLDMTFEERSKLTPEQRDAIVSRDRSGR